MVVPEWHTDALCRQVDPELFFPTDAVQSRAAKAICRECPALTPCAEYSLADPSLDGIWAGMSKHERSRARVERRTA